MTDKPLKPVLARAYTDRTDLAKAVPPRPPPRALSPGPRGPTDTTDKPDTHKLERPKPEVANKPEKPEANKPEKPEANKPEKPEANKPEKPEFNKPERVTRQQTSADLKTDKPKPPPVHRAATTTPESLSETDKLENGRPEKKPERPWQREHKEETKPETKPGKPEKPPEKPPETEPEKPTKPAVMRSITTTEMDSPTAGDKPMKPRKTVCTPVGSSSPSSSASSETEKLPPDRPPPAPPRSPKLKSDEDRPRPPAFPRAATTVPDKPQRPGEAKQSDVASPRTPSGPRASPAPEETPVPPQSPRGGAQRHTKGPSGAPVNPGDDPYSIFADISAIHPKATAPAPAKYGTKPGFDRPVTAPPSALKKESLDGKSSNPDISSTKKDSNEPKKDSDAQPADAKVESKADTDGTAPDRPVPPKRPVKPKSVSFDDAPFSEDDEPPPEEDDDDDEMTLGAIDFVPAPNPVPKHIRMGMGATVVRKAGWLQKSSHKGQVGLKTFIGRNLDLWKKRWVVLQTDGISYYATEEDAGVGNKLGFVPLHANFDLDVEEDIIAVTDPVENRTIRLKGPKPEITEEWAIALEELRDEKVRSKMTRKTEEERALRLAEIMEKQLHETMQETVVFRQGYLMKQGGSQNSALLAFGKASWKRRWVVLSNFGVSYFETEDSCKAGQNELSFIPFDVNFNFVEIAKASDESVFSLVSNSRAMSFRAESKEQKWEWIEAMVTAREAFAARFAPSAQDYGLADLKPQPQPVEEKLVDRNCIREGYLTKQKFVGTKTEWKSRYFVLSAGELVYYKHPKDLKPLGTIQLDGRCVVQASKDQAFTFFMVPVSTAKQTILSAKDVQDQIDWLAAFQQSVPSMTVVRGVASDAHMSIGRTLLQVTRRSTRSIKEGFMLKQGHLNKKWKRRYFVLEPATLEYYKNPHDKHVKGAFPLGDSGNSVTADTDVGCTLVLGSKSTKLCCESPLELLAWLTAFQAIKQLTVITNTGGKKSFRRGKTEADLNSS